MMLIRFSLPSSNPITLLDTVHPLSDTEPKIGKSRKVENPDIGRSAPPHNLIQIIRKSSKLFSAFSWIETQGRYC